MTKADLKKIMDDNYILSSDVDDAIYFVEDLLEFQARELEQNEPYAINTIRRLRDAAHELLYLHGYVEDARE